MRITSGAKNKAGFAGKRQFSRRASRTGHLGHAPDKEVRSSAVPGHVGVPNRRKAIADPYAEPLACMQHNASKLPRLLSQPRDFTAAVPQWADVSPLTIPSS